MNASDHRNPIVFSLLSATLIIAHQVAAKATRDALFLSQFSVTELPKIIIVAGLISILGVIFVSSLLTRFGPARVIPVAFALSAALFLANWFAYPVRPALVASALYLQIALFGAVLISGFWSLVNEIFDPHAAKQTITRIAAAATFGGVLGGLVADGVATAGDTRSMLAILCGLHVACAFSCNALGGRVRNVRPASLEVRSGIRVLAGSRYLLTMAALIISVSVLTAFVDYAFKAEATRLYTDERSLVRFFGRFYAIIGVVTFLLQSSFGPYVMRRFGLGASLAALPVIVVLTGLVHLVFARVSSAVLLRGAQVVFANSFFRAAFETLYAPLKPTQKRPTKAIVDVAADRLGDIVGGTALLGVLAFAPAGGHLPVTGAAILIAGIALLLVARLYTGYVRQLAENLRGRTDSDSTGSVAHGSDRSGSGDAERAAERALLAARVRDLKNRRVGSRHTESVPPLPSVNREQAIAPEPTDALTRAIANLCSRDVARIRETLQGDFMDDRLAPFLLKLLAIDELAEDVSQQLRWLTPTYPGLMADALLNPDLPLPARQRIPAVLEVSHSKRAVLSLTLGLDDSEFNVRYACARALMRMRGRDTALTFPADDIYARIEAEFDASDTPLSTPHGPIDNQYTVMRGENVMTHGVEHVFALLCLIHDNEAVTLAMRAIFRDDPTLRGTALEYLDNILPEDIRHRLWLHLGIGGAGDDSYTARSGKLMSDLLNELRGALQPDEL